MQLHFSRVARLGAVALGSITMLGAGANIASATSIRYGSASVNPTSSSPLVPTGGHIGSTAILGSSFTAPQQSGGPNPTSGNCTIGSINANISGANPASTVAFNTASLTIGTANGTPSGCSDNGPVYDLQRIVLASPTTFNVVNPSTTSGANGDLTVSNPTFTVTVKVVETDLFVNCPVSLYTAGNVVGVIRNSNASFSNQPTVTFNNIRVRTTSTSGTCAASIGNGSSLAQSSVFSVTFGPLRVTSGTGTGSRVGVFS